MAKGYGLTGKIQGKLGSKVYRIEAGEQIISEYNPTKQDRKSNKQILQRSKIALANQISRCAVWTDLVGLSNNRSAARRLFVGNIVKNTTAVMDGDDKAVATADLAAIIFSKGSDVLVDSQSINKIAEHGTLVNSQMTFNEESGVARYILMCLPMRDVPNPTLGAFSDIFVGVSDEVVIGQVCRATAVMNYSTLLTGYHVYVYAVPIIPNTLKKRVIYNKVVSGETAGQFSADAMVQLARSDMFGATQYLGVIAY